MENLELKLSIKKLIDVFCDAILVKGVTGFNILFELIMTVVTMRIITECFVFGLTKPKLWCTSLSHVLSENIMLRNHSKIFD